MGPYSFFVPPVKFCILRVLSILQLLLYWGNNNSLTISPSLSQCHGREPFSPSSDGQIDFVVEADQHHQGDDALHYQHDGHEELQGSYSTLHKVMRTKNHGALIWFLTSNLIDNFESSDTRVPFHSSEVDSQNVYTK